jgi:hypothetical protein
MGGSAMKSKELNLRLMSMFASGLLVLFLAIPSLVEAYRLRSLSREIVQMHESLNETTAQRERLESTRKELTDKLAEYDARSLLAGQQEGLRQQLLEMIRRRQGQLRSLEIGNPIKRYWAGPTDRPDQDVYSGLADEQSGFLLHIHAIDLQVDGTHQSTQEIIRDVLSKRWLAEIHTINLAPIAKDRVRLVISMRMYGLSTDDGSLENVIAMEEQVPRR